MTIEEAVKFVEAISRVGISAEQAGDALRKMSQVLYDVNRLDNNSKTQMSRIVQLEQENSQLNNRLCQTEANTNMIYSIQDQLYHNTNEIEDIKINVYNLSESNKEIENSQNRIINYAIYLEDKISDLQSARDAKTENPNQKSDLEISSQIEVNPFLSGFIDLDSEEFLK